VEIVINNLYNFDSGDISNLDLLNLELELNIDVMYLHYMTDFQLLSINKSYLDHDYFTDIITFDLRDDLSNDVELFISIDRLKENAKIHKTSAKQEFYRLLIHGMLHLSGIGDKTSEEKIYMTDKENYYLNILFHVKQ